MEKILADIIVVVHFLWIIFMIWGFGFTLCAVLGVYVFRTDRIIWNEFFDRWIFRTLHIIGIVFVAILTLLDKYCPLTIMENLLRRRYDPAADHPGSFIVHYIERLVYPDIDPNLIVVPTLFVAAFTIAVFAIRPPRKIPKK